MQIIYKVSLGIFLLFSTVSISNAELEVEMFLNQAVHTGGDHLGLDVFIENKHGDTTVDLYVCFEILGDYYFYPSFSTTELDHLKITITSGETFSENVIPLTLLPGDLPDLDSKVYAVCFQPGSWDLVSNIASSTIKLRTEILELPEPDYNNTFFFMPGVEGLNYASSQDQFDQVAIDMFSHFQNPGIYVRRGITILDPVIDSENQSKALEAAAKVAPTGLALGYHVGVTCHHTYGAMTSIRQADRRNNQWDSTGEIFDTGHDDLSTVTLSRYASDVVAARRNRAVATGNSYQSAINQYPDTVIYVNGPIEVELRKASDTDYHYADYSPYTVKEFRDWLLHTGIYNDHTGKFSGQGVPLELIGNKNFASAESPSDPVNGISFNQLFDTQFETWNLLYWDPDIYPERLPLDANPKPVPGENGWTNGGFDPPRDETGSLIGGNDLFKKVWDGWRTDQNFGNQTGFGFRQSQVHRYIEDNSRWLQESGVPFERSYTHQIPVDFIGNWIRERSSASPHWTAFNNYSNPGFTAYFDTAVQDDLFFVARTLAPRWGMFEFHPDPYMEQAEDFYRDALEKLYSHRCNVLVPIDLYEGKHGDYKLIGSPFEVALCSFFQANWQESYHKRFDQPYQNTVWIDYRPPKVKNLVISPGQVSWSSLIWESISYFDWNNWSEFSHFEVHMADFEDFAPDSRTLLGTTRNNWYNVNGYSGKYFKILSVSMAGLKSQY